MDRNFLQLPVWTFYYVALVWVGIYFKWQTLLGFLHPIILIQTVCALFVVYALVTVVANLQVFSWRMLIFPPYALLQAILMPMVGSFYYVVCAHRQGFLGRYRFAYRRAAQIKLAPGIADEQASYVHQHLPEEPPAVLPPPRQVRRGQASWLLLGLAVTGVACGLVARRSGSA